MGVRYPVVLELSGSKISVYICVWYPILPELSGSNICVYMDVWQQELMQFSCCNISMTFFHMKPPLSGDFCTKLNRDIFCYFFAVIFEKVCNALKGSKILYKPLPQQDILLDYIFRYETPPPYLLQFFPKYCI